MSNFYSTTAGSVNVYSDSTTTTDNRVNIVGKLYKHIATGEVRKVIYADDDCIILRDKSIYSTCYTKDFLKFWKLYEAPNTSNTPDVSDDKVNHPSHYTWLKDLCGIEVIDITRHMDNNLGNSIKYILRSGHKREKGYTDKQKTIEDLKKAVWYLNDEIKLLSNE